MNITSQRWCAYGGFAFMGLFLAGLLVAGFMPPSPDPGSSAHEMAQFFRDNALRIRVGLSICCIGTGFLAQWAVAISVQLARVEGRRFTPLAWTQMIIGGLFVLEFLLPFLILQAAAYRPDRSDEAIQSLIDTGWIMFGTGVGPVVLQGIIIGVVILRDQRPNPIFPRWAGYFSIWAVLITATGGLIPFFKTGPFTWQGLLAWWLPLPVFGSWMFVVTWLVLRAIKRQETEGDPLETDPAILADRLDESAREIEQLRRAVAQLCAESIRPSAAETA